MAMHYVQRQEEELEDDGSGEDIEGVDDALLDGHPDAGATLVHAQQAGDQGEEEEELEWLDLSNRGRRSRHRLVNDSMLRDGEGASSRPPPPQPKKFKHMTHKELDEHQIESLGIKPAEEEDEGEGEDAEDEDLEEMDEETEDGDEPGRRRRRKKKSPGNERANCMTAMCMPEDYRRRCIFARDIEKERAAKEEKCVICIALKPKERDRGVTDTFTEIIELFDREPHKRTEDIYRDQIDQYNAKLYYPLKEMRRRNRGSEEGDEGEDVVEPLRKRQLRRHFQRNGGCGHSQTAFARYNYENHKEIAEELRANIRFYNPATKTTRHDLKVLQEYGKVMEAADKWRRMVANPEATGSGTGGGSSSGRGRKRGAPGDAQSGAGESLEEKRKKKTLANTARQQKTGLGFY